VVDRSTDVELDLPTGEFIGDRASIGHGAGEAIEAHDQHVAFAYSRQFLTQPGTVTIGAGKPIIDIDTLGVDSQASEGVVCAVRFCESVLRRQ